METVALTVLCVGGLLSVAGGIWFLVVAFSESVLWGIGCLLIPLVSLAFLILNFGDAWRPAAVSLVGSALTFGAIFLMA